MKVLISGGHPSPAFAIIDTIRERYPDIEIAFVGRVVAQDSTGQLASEAHEASEHNIPFYSITTAKWGQTIWQKSLATGSVARATIAARALLKIIKPDVFVSFGSYVAVPIALASWLSGIPIITHEQTRAAGVSNRFIARLASAIAISYPESAPFFPANKTVLTGLPLRPQLFVDHPTPPSWLPTAFLNSQLPILYITGGSTGSHAINTLIGELLPSLLTHWRVIQPCGRPTKQANWQETLRGVKQELEQSVRDRYQVVEQLTTAELAWIYRQPTLVFGRSGANTTAEVAAFDLPAVFVPLPLSNYDEQHQNATALVKAGRVVLIDQNDLTVASALDAIDQIRSSVIQKASAVAPNFETNNPNTANKQLIELILKLAKH